MSFTEITSYCLHGSVLLEKLTGSQLVKKFPALLISLVRLQVAEGGTASKTEGNCEYIQ